MNPISRVYAFLGAALVLFGLSVLAAAPAWAGAAGTFIRPVHGSISLTFAAKYVDAAGKTRKHRGIDIGTTEGTAVVAPAAGKVAFAGNTPYGLSVSIVHAGAIKTTYLPLAKITVAKGSAVQGGQIIGYIGSSGDPSGTAPHMHMGAIFAGEYFDPASLFRGDFKPDISKIIRRGDIPPSGGAVFTLPPAAAAVVGIPGFFGWLWDKFISFIDWAATGADGVWSWMTSTAAYNFSYLRTKLARFGKNQLGAIGRIGFTGVGTAFGGGSGFGVTVFDPSGDATGPDNCVNLKLSGAPARVEIFNSDGDSVWSLEEWQARGIEIVWTGVDRAGRIVPNGTYTVIIEYNGSTEGFLVEARWHL